MRLVDGAQAIRNDLPASSTVVVDVPLEAGDEQGTTVSRLSSLRLVRDRQLQVLRSLDDIAVTIGGDCGVELAAVEHALRDPDVAVVWFDAHADANSPTSSPSGAFHGMVLRTLLGDGPDALVPAAPLRADRVILAGTRAVDDAEAEYLSTAGIPTLSGTDLTPESLVAAIDASGATSVYLHIDLDVLDPAEIGGIGYPEPFGLSAVDLVALIRAVKDRFTLAGAGLVEFAPGSEEQASDDLPTILRLLGALTRK